MQNTISIKIVIFALHNNELCVFLSNSKLPQGALQAQNLDKQVEEIFFTATGMKIDEDYREQLYTVSSLNIIEIVYIVLLSPEKTEKIQTHFLPLKMVKEKTDSHILTYAVQRLRWKIEYTNVIYSLLPENFTLSELQKGYETVLGRQLDKRNFRKKMLSLHFLAKTGKKTIGPTRPATMYQFIERKPVIIKVFS